MRLRLKLKFVIFGLVPDKGLPLGIGVTVYDDTFPGVVPLAAGNYLIGDFFTVYGPTSVNHWVVIDGTGQVTQYTPLNSTCPP